MIKLETEYDRILYREMKNSFFFLYDKANRDVHSSGFGLAVDISSKENVASIASVGFLLGGMRTAVEEGFISREDARTYVNGTMLTFLHHVDHHLGMFAHFVDINTGKRLKNCEFSTIDTMLLLAGAICNIGYFDEEVDQNIHALLMKSDYRNYIYQKPDGNYAIPMAYNADAVGRRLDYREDGFCKTNWDFMAEHLALYFIVAGHPDIDPEIAQNLYYTMERTIGSYKSNPFIFECGGSLFIHQYSHSFVDFQNYKDGHGFDWFKNSVSASIANYNFCIDYPHSKTYSKYLWGTTACQSPKGYVVNGSKPNSRKSSDKKPWVDGTFTPCGPLGSIVFVPDLVKETVLYIEEHYPELKGPYGYYDGLNLDHGGVVEKYIGINKGVTLLMLSNYFNRTVWDSFMNTEWIQRAVKVLGFSKDGNLYTK